MDEIIYLKILNTVPLGLWEEDGVSCNESSKMLRLISKPVEWYEQGAEAAMTMIYWCSIVEVHEIQKWVTQVLFPI